jgi:hypothetical protein
MKRKGTCIHGALHCDIGLRNYFTAIMKIIEAFAQSNLSIPQLHKELTSYSLCVWHIGYIDNAVVNIYCARSTNLEKTEAKIWYILLAH